MTTLYYLSSIVFIIIELAWILSPIERANSAIRFLELSKQFKGKKRTEYSEEYKEELNHKLPLVFVFVWFIVGLFSFQWVAFLAMLLFQLVIMAPISNLTKIRSKPLYITANWINSVIGLAFALFVIINHYHLKIDLLPIVINLFK
jgi:hypothetical protein